MSEAEQDFESGAGSRDEQQAAEEAVLSQSVGEDLVPGADIYPATTTSTESALQQDVTVGADLVIAERDQPEIAAFVPEPSASNIVLTQPDEDYPSQQPTVTPAFHDDENDKNDNAASDLGPGEFDSTPELCESSPQQSTGKGNVEAVSFDNHDTISSSSPPAANLQDENDDDDDDDDDDDFGAFSVGPLVSASPVEAINAENEHDIDCNGDSTDTSHRAPTDAVITDDNEEHYNDADDDDFGNFDEAVLSQSGDIAKPDSAAVTAGEFLEGHMGSASPAVDHNSVENVYVENVALTNHVTTASALTDDNEEENNDEDDFGDFDDAAIFQVKENVNAGSIASDSGNFDGVVEDGQTVVGATAAATDFLQGTLRGPSQAEDCTKVGNGDLAALTHHAPTASIIANDEDEDDFGDFDEAIAPQSEVNNSAGSDSNFGNFDSFMEDAQPAVAATAAKSSPAIDDLIQSARRIFPKLFNWHERPSPTPSDDAGMEEREAPTIQSILESLGRNDSGNEARAYNRERLITRLREQSNQPELTPQSLIVNEGNGPYSHYFLPRSFIGDKRTARRKKNNGATGRTSFILPDVLNVRLPPSPERLRSQDAANAPLTAATTEMSTITSSSSSSLSRQSKSETGANGSSRPSQTAQDFANRIPDLSFMLLSTLMSPKDS